MIRALSIVFFATLPLPGIAGSLCVGNQTNEHFLFAVESRVTGDRQLSELGPTGQLCINTPDKAAKGVVSVFASHQAEEGCSRLVQGGGPEILVAFAEFDRCEWSSHQKN